MQRNAFHTQSHTLNYNDGVIITGDNKGRIKSITFYLLGDTPLKSADVKTQQGIARETSLRGIVKAYSKPFFIRADKELSALGHKDATLYYKVRLLRDPDFGISYGSRSLAVVFIYVYKERFSNFHPSAAQIPLLEFGLKHPGFFQA